MLMEFEGWRLQWVGKGDPEPVRPLVWGRLLAAAMLAVDAMSEPAQDGHAEHTDAPQLPLIDEHPKTGKLHAADTAVVVQPVGGRWPHIKGRWTDAERAAAFEMRHRWRVRDRDLERITGAARQAINMAIGDKIAPYRDIWPDRLEWRPSEALMHACFEGGKPQQKRKQLQF